jgi:ATP-dependent exoDNAse (exonuclease V) beta subunit
MIILRKPKDSMFDDIAMTPITLGSLRIEHPASDVGKVRKEVPDVTITHYGTQESGVSETDEPKEREAILFGTALHYGLEMLGGFEIACLPQAMEAVRNRYGEILGSEALADIESRIMMLLEEERFCQLLEGAKISKERALAYRGEMKQIDLLLEYETHMVVVDYKSAQKSMQKHRHQVHYYMQAIEKLTQKPTKGMIIYLEKEEISYINLN